MKTCFFILIAILFTIKGIEAQPVWKNFITAGGVNHAEGKSIAKDKNENLYITGWFRNVAKFDNHTLNGFNTDEDNLFVAKYNKEGNCLWAVKAGAPQSYIYSNGMALDENNNIYVTGYFFGSVNFGTIYLTSGNFKEKFVAKLDSNGIFLWAKSFGQGEAKSIVTDLSGSTYVSGEYNGNVQFDNFQFTSSLLSNTFLAKLDPSGNTIWAKSADGSDGIHNEALSREGNNLFLTGTYRDTAYFDNITLLPGNGSWDFYSVQFDLDGNSIASKSGSALNHSNLSEGSQTILDTSGDIITIGNFFGNVNFGNNSTLNSISRDIFLIKYSTAGDIRWAKNIGGPGTMAFPSAMKIDDEGNIYFTAGFKGTLIFENISVNSTVNGNFGMVVAKYDKDGGLVWVKSEDGQSENIFPNSLILGKNNDVWVTGRATGSVSLDSTLYNLPNLSHIFIAKIEQYSGVGIDFNNKTSGINIYPNPTSGRVYFSKEGSEGVNVKIFDFNGKVVYNNGMNLELLTDGIDISSLGMPGIYFVQVNSLKGSFCKKIILK